MIFFGIELFYLGRFLSRSELMYRNDAMACKIQQRRLKLLSFAYEKKNDVQTQSGIFTF